MRGMATEVWQRGPIAGVDPYLMPVAHTFLQVKEDIQALAASVPAEHLWVRPAGAASVGFHLRHAAGSTSRLLTYARGERLTPEALEAAKRESNETPPISVLLSEIMAALDRALAQVRDTPREVLLAERKVGRRELPTTTLGLLFHAAEHATRHVGQAMTTARIVGGTRPVNDGTA